MKAFCPFFTQFQSYHWVPQCAGGAPSLLAQEHSASVKPNLVQHLLDSEFAQAPHSPTTVLGHGPPLLPTHLVQPESMKAFWPFLTQFQSYHWVPQCAGGAPSLLAQEHSESVKPNLV